MSFSPAQIKGKIKNIARQSHADARILMRIYMMERFLERVANSKYSKNFIIKGGILVTSMIGVSLRSTMDIDTTVRNFNLTTEDTLNIIKEICEIDLDDRISFEVKNIENIMDEMEYSGIRISMNALIENMVTPIKIDISTDDVITPRAVIYDYKLMLEDRSIKLWSYNLETILAEKLQTILARGSLNTRMRDFYDVYALILRYNESLDLVLLKKAFEATCKKRHSSDLITSGKVILEKLQVDSDLENLWSSYQKKYPYAMYVTYENVIKSAIDLFGLITYVK